MRLTRPQKILKCLQHWDYIQNLLEPHCVCTIRTQLHVLKETIQLQPCLMNGFHISKTTHIPFYPLDLIELDRGKQMAIHVKAAENMHKSLCVRLSKL